MSSEKTMQTNYITVDKLPVGKSATVKTVGGEGPLRLRLLDMGIIPGTKVTMHRIAPLGDPLEIMLRGYMLSMRKDDARLIEAEVCD